jgi:diadenosine tetraphosphate (Ap4A) HIT family hydrolase
MKHQYFGDINDYRKYGLIRVLSGSGTISTSICWMLTPDTEGNRDGKKTSYLSHPEVWRHHDPALFDFLQERIHNPGTDRGIDEKALAKVLPGVRFFTPFLHDATDVRDEYFKALFAGVSPRGLLFFDPDNGLEVSSCRKGTKNSSRYLYWDEVRKAYESCNSVLIYQHYQRVDRKKFIRTIFEKAAAETGASVFAYATSHVVFFLIARPEHVDHFHEANTKLAQTWHSQILVSTVETWQALSTQSTCPFCDLDKSRIILDNDHAIAFHDGFPISPGHSLIVPKRHISSYFEATKEEQTAMLDLLAEMRERLLAEHNAEGFNIGINDGAAAGQTVMHLHIHLIPRYADDMEDPRGGVRWIFPDKAAYWKE